MNCDTQNLIHTLSYLNPSWHEVLINTECCKKRLLLLEQYAISASSYRKNISNRIQSDAEYSSNHLVGHLGIPKCVCFHPTFLVDMP
jgi:hypothetical protein